MTVRASGGTVAKVSARSAVRLSFFALLSAALFTARNLAAFSVGEPGCFAIAAFTFERNLTWSAALSCFMTEAIVSALSAASAI